MKPEDHIVAADYVSGQIADDAREAARKHIEQCSECREAVAAVRAARERRPAAPPPVVPFAPSEAEQKTSAVLAPRFAHRAWQFINRLGRFGIVIGLTVAVLILPPPASITAEGHRALAALVFTASILALEPVSLPIAALMVPFVQVALGIARTSEAFEPFSRPVVFLILSSLFLAEALRKTDSHAGSLSWPSSHRAGTWRRCCSD